MTLQDVSKRSYRQFFSSLGFDDDPFQYTNADEEDRLTDYFIPPPYFQSVFGDPDHPKSFVVFAPRGGGKSAQRRIIENECKSNQVLSITYDRFEFPDVKYPSEITLHAHIKIVIRYIIMGLLVTLYSDPTKSDNLSKPDKELFVKLSSEYLSNINEQSLKVSLDSLKSLKDKVKDFWNEWLPAINVGLGVILKTLLKSDIDTFKNFPISNFEKPQYQKYNLELVIDLAKKIGYKAIYILIDRVDETVLSGNNSKASFQLIEPLMRDLELLEMKGLGFKFFLWDQLEPFYNEIARTDRIRQETLEWGDEMLIKMWNKRLAAFSKGKVSELKLISEATIPSIDEIALIFANRSPRDMIRVAAQILSEQQEINSQSNEISKVAVIKGVEKFSSSRTREILSSNTLNDLRKIQQVDFTIPYLANTVFREAQATTRNRIMRWRREGAIVDVEKIDNPNPAKKTQVKLMALQDIRVAKVVHSDMNVFEFISLKFKKCPFCGEIVLRDWGDRDSVTRCHACQADVTAENFKNDWEIMKRREFNTDYQRRTRKERNDLNDLPLFRKN